MAKLDVIKVIWIHDEEVHIDVPDGGTWWARPVPTAGGGTVWELNDPDNEDEAAGYYDTADDAFEWLGEEHKLPVVIAKDNR